MSKTYTNNMKAIACLLIFVHHFYMHNSGVVQILGIWMVSVFFFFSAYGLCFSLEKNIGFAEYLKKRISKVWIPYLLVNLAAEGAPIKGKFTPFLKLDNLLNWNYQAIDEYPMPGISLTVGARYKFF